MRCVLCIRLHMTTAVSSPSEKDILKDLQRVQNNAHEVLIQTGPQHVKDITKRNKERWAETLGNGGTASDLRPSSPPRPEETSTEQPTSPGAYARRRAKVTEKW